MLDIKEITANYHFAINHIDDVEARKTLKEISTFIESQDIKNSNPELFKKLQSAIVNLKIVALSQISDEEVADILRNHYLESFHMQISMENQLTGKLFLIPEIPRDNLRKKLRRAILENQQKIGNLSISQWITNFEKLFPTKTRTDSAPIEFISTNTQASTLNSNEKNQVKDLLHTYDNVLAFTPTSAGKVLIQSEIGNNSIYNVNEPSKDISTSPIQPEMKPATHKTIQILLSEGLHKFDKLGEQLITSQPLKLQYSSSPVRPSIKNWLADYHQIYGQGAHSEMNRGSYLFNSENTKRLSNTERQRLAIILKSLDLDLPIDIDTNAQQIVFNTQITAISNKNENQDIQKTSIVSTNDRNQSMESSQEPLRAHLEKIEESDLSLHQYPLSANKISFSSPQKLSYERTNKEQTQPQKFIPAVNRPQISTNMPIKKTFGKNVVNLKDI
jgi:hypothetical protein